MKNKICVVGSGNWGFNHVKTLAHLSSLGGGVEISQENKDRVRNLYPETPIFSSIEDSFESKFDGYIIVTPVATHFEIAKKIINKGRHVLIEKPMTLNSSEAYELVELAKFKKVNAMVGHVLLFHPAFVVIKDMIDTGELGDVQYMYSILP